MAWELFEIYIYQSCSAQNKTSGEIYNRIFDTCINSVMPHGKNMFKISSDIAMKKMFAYT